MFKINIFKQQQWFLNYQCNLQKQIFYLQHLQDKNQQQSLS